MADEWPTSDIITDDTGSQIDCKPLKERTEEKFEGEENVEWQRRSIETSSEGSTFTTNESGSVLSDADRERSSASSVISEKLDDQTFEGEEVDESDDEAYWNEVLAAEAERALERAHIPHPNFFFDDSNRFGPNITILSSTSSHANEEIAVKAAARAIEQFPTNKTLAARLIKKQCEEKFNGAWHCIVSDGDVGFFSRNDEHIHFTFRHNTIYIFPHQCYEPNEMRIRRLKNPDNTVMEIQIPESVKVITNGMNLERQQYAIRLAINTIAKYGSEYNNAFIAEKIVDGFEEIYGAHFHCAVSDKDIGCHIRYDPDNIIIFSIDGLTICLFKQNPINEDPFTSLHPLRERKISGVLVPLKQPRRQYVIKSGMNAEMLQLAIIIAQRAISESKSVQKIAHTVRTEFESKHTGPYHCIVANGQSGFYAHYDEKDYARFVVDDHCVFLFRSKDIPAKDLRVTRYIPIGCAAPDIRVVSSGMTRPKERFAIDLTSEGIQRYVGDKMRAAKHVVERFEERHGTPYHCAISEGELGFSVHHKAAMHFKIGSTAVFLFRNL